MTIHDLFNADVEIARDVSYVDTNADPRNTLDIYSSPARAGLPVVIFYHGGGWRSGDKRLFEHLGRAMVVRGIVAVTVNYRLTPEVQHPAHARDCAHAFAWTRENIASHGGNPSSIFLMGHSAGAHLAMLIAFDRRYLDRLNIPATAVCGVIALSGASDLTLHSETTEFTTREQIEEAFGSTEAELAAASPVAYIRPDLPPVLVAVAEKDSEGLRAQGRRLAEVLRTAGDNVVFISIKGRDHYSIVRRFGPGNDPTVGAVVNFIDRLAGS